MNNGMNEIVKNMYTCAALMLAVGIGMLLMGKMTIGTWCIIIGVVFGIIGLIMFINNKKNNE